MPDYSKPLGDVVKCDRKSERRHIMRFFEFPFLDSKLNFDVTDRDAMPR